VCPLYDLKELGEVSGIDKSTGCNSSYYKSRETFRYLLGLRHPRGQQQRYYADKVTVTTLTGSGVFDGRWLPPWTDSTVDETVTDAAHILLLHRAC
jgi:hypothetical protein